MTIPSYTNEYTAISKDALVENTKIEFDVFLKNDLGGNSRYILFCRGNQEFSAERKGELLGRNTHRLYISTKDTNKYLKYQEKTLSKLLKIAVKVLYRNQEHFIRLQKIWYRTFWTTQSPARLLNGLLHG
jgi:hypothetical protein